jgi:hypothetical protein
MSNSLSFARRASALLLTYILLCGSLRWSLAYTDDSRATIVLDAGSTGTRIYLYEYHEDHPVTSMAEMGQKRLPVALNAFIEDIDSMHAHFGELVEFAKERIPAEEWGTTSISLKATAGLRTESTENQTVLMEKVSEIFASTGFHSIHSENRVISGAEEAILGLMGLSAAMRQLPLQATGIADMGGSSQQLSFEIDANVVDSVCSQYVKNVFTTLPGPYSEDLSHTVFAHSFAGMGLISAMDEVLANYEPPADVCSSPDGVGCHVSVDEDDAKQGEPIDHRELAQQLQAFEHLHPCLGPGKYEYEVLQGTRSNDIHGPGNFTACAEEVRQFVADRLKILGEDSVVGCARKYRPNNIVGVDNFKNIMEVLGIHPGIQVSPQDIAELGAQICMRPWEDVHRSFKSRNWKTYRSQRACFGSAYIYVILVDIYGLGLSDHVFQTIEKVHSLEVNWALGSAFGEAVKLRY